MGGAGKFPYPKWVWSPAGGWWHNPVQWKRNTIIVSMGIAAIAALAYSYAEPRTLTYTRKYGELAKVHDDHHDSHADHSHKHH